ncbi:MULTISPECIES: hypothetical protein [Paenibacillus]|uniref:Lipoprotein n=1 Tax=Paenibacillus borealis TaxID=160799 RepID=A0ABX3GR43_PAEBO|nr:hypothetical protein [Paenibacillus borealis]OMD35145.1 hypothetical protein BSK56_33240 [Paenibacillus borealis]
MKKTLTILFMICVVALTSSCTIVEDARDNREPNIIILTGNYRLFQSNDEINFIKGKLDEDPVKVDSFIEEVGWNKKYIAFKRITLDKKHEEGILDVSTGKVILAEDKETVIEQLHGLGVKDLELYPVKQLIEEKKKKLETN